MQDDLPILHFDSFALDRANRRLSREGQALDVGSRYFDALVLLVQARGDLVTKDRFMDEVWHGVPVTDEALTQCIRSLRRALDDNAASPRFIATVPKHGYRFVGDLAEPQLAQDGGIGSTDPSTAIGPAIGPAGMLAAAATLGGAAAGLAGGLLYAAILAAAPGGGGSAVFLTILALCVAVGILGGAGTGIGMALASGVRGRTAASLILGGGVGGLVVGAIGRLVGLDVFRVLAGIGIGPVTGLLEGAIIGMATGGGCAIALTRRGPSALLLAALTGAAGGALVSLIGGRLMAGSLALLDASLESSQLQVGRLGALLGDPQFGPVSLIATASLEAAVFVTAVALAVRRSVRQGPRQS